MQQARILVVEDEPSIREVVSLYLKRAGYQVSVVDDGRAALEVLSGGAFDLVPPSITDTFSSEESTMERVDSLNQISFYFNTCCASKCLAAFPAPRFFARFTGQKQRFGRTDPAIVPHCFDQIRNDPG